MERIIESAICAGVAAVSVPAGVFAVGAGWNVPGSGVFRNKLIMLTNAGAWGATFGVANGIAIMARIPG